MTHIKISKILLGKNYSPFDERIWLFAHNMIGVKEW